MYQRFLLLIHLITHFIPLSPISDSPGNQVKMLLHYNASPHLSTSTDDIVDHRVDTCFFPGRPTLLLDRVVVDNPN